MKNVEIYTDGGCRGNGQDRENIGGIGGVLIYGDYQKNLKRAIEIQPIINGAWQSLPHWKCSKSHAVSRFTLIRLMVNSLIKIDKWMESKGWTRGKAGALRNAELWQELDRLVSQHEVIYKGKGPCGWCRQQSCRCIVNQAMDELWSFCML